MTIRLMFPVKPGNGMEELAQDRAAACPINAHISDLAARSAIDAIRPQISTQNHTRGGRDHA
jgi:hypothetical protein